MGGGRGTRIGQVSEHMKEHDRDEKGKEGEDTVDTSDLYHKDHKRTLFVS